VCASFFFGGQFPLIAVLHPQNTPPTPTPQKIFLGKRCHVTWNPLRACVSVKCVRVCVCVCVCVWCGVVWWFMVLFLCQSCKVVSKVRVSAVAAAVSTTGVSSARTGVSSVRTVCWNSLAAMRASLAAGACKCSESAGEDCLEGTEEQTEASTVLARTLLFPFDRGAGGGGDRCSRDRLFGLVDLVSIILLFELLLAAKLRLLLSRAFSASACWAALAATTAGGGGKSCSTGSAPSSTCAIKLAIATIRCLSLSLFVSLCLSLSLCVSLPVFPLSK